MSETGLEQLQGLKSQFDKGVNPSNKELTNDEKATLAVNIAQQEFITNFYSTQGIDYLNKALNWPSSYEKTLKRQYPEISMQQNMVALATHELLESCWSGSFSPTEEAGILVSDVGRFADKLESETDLSVSKFGDILFSRFANAIVALGGFRDKERRDCEFNGLQKTISKVNNIFSQLQISGGDEQLADLVDLFNKTKWDRQNLLEGHPIYLVENLFRVYQGLPVRKTD